MAKRTRKHAIFIEVTRTSATRARRLESWLAGCFFGAGALLVLGTVLATS